MLRRRRSVSLVLVLLGACSVVLNGEEHTGNAPPDMGMADLGPQPLEPSDACNRFADVLCEAAYDCCSTRPSDCTDRDSCLSSCKRDYQVTCLETLGGFVTDTMAGYDSDVAGEVLWEAQRRASTCDLTLPEVFAVDLMEIPQGSLPEGDPGCDPVEGVGMVDIVKANYCAGELVCLSTGGALGSWACGERRAMDEPCTTYLECERDLGCGMSMACGPREPNGGSCFLAGDCESFVCRRDGAEVYGECVAATEENVYCAFLDPPNR
jgi:hypothetical protein